MSKKNECACACLLEGRRKEEFFNCFIGEGIRTVFWLAMTLPLDVRSTPNVADFQKLVALEVIDLRNGVAADLQNGLAGLQNGV